MQYPSVFQVWSRLATLKMSDSQLDLGKSLIKLWKDMSLSLLNLCGEDKGAKQTQTRIGHRDLSRMTRGLTMAYLDYVESSVQLYSQLVSIRDSFQRLDAILALSPVKWLDQGSDKVILEMQSCEELATRFKKGKGW